MLNSKTIAVVIPCYNEEKQIGKVIETIPDFVDKIYVVDDRSKDRTEAIVKKYIKNNSHLKKSSIPNRYQKTVYSKAEYILEEIKDEEFKKHVPNKTVNLNPGKNRVVLISHLINSGVGASIATGYFYSLRDSIDCTAVMAGDGQMDPSELRKICLPVIQENVDYVKGNRLSHRSALLVIPKIRFLGNSILSLLTKISSGYWHISDTQTGYTAISLKALQAIRIHQIYPRYGCPNDILVKLNVAFCSVKEIPIKPVYDIGERSKMKIGKVILPITILLIKSFFKRLYIKYLFRDFHPLFLFYHLAFVLFLINIPFTFIAIKSLMPGVEIDVKDVIIFVFCSISAFQALFFAMWMDMQDNERLQKI